MSRMSLFNQPKRFWQRGITKIISIEINDANACAVLHFTGAKIVQEWSPLLVFFEIFGNVFGEKNVPGVATIHHSLGQVDARAGHVRSSVRSRPPHH